MTKKRYLTAELPKPLSYGIFYDGKFLTTYEVCQTLNEYVDEVEELNKKITRIQDKLTDKQKELEAKEAHVGATVLKELLNELIVI